MAAAKKPSAMEFIVESLKKNPQASYGEIKEAADKKKLSIYPIMYGRAQALLGIVKSKPKKKKAAKKKAATARKAASAGGRKKAARRRSAGTVSADSLESIVETVRRLEHERDVYRQALEDLQGVLADALR